MTLESAPDQATQARSPVEEPWAVDADRLLEQLQVDATRGLSAKEARTRLGRFGRNRIEGASRPSAGQILLRQVQNLIVALLVTAAAASFAFGQSLEGVAIVIALAINVLTGFFTELKATRALEALEKLSESQARVLRGGRTTTVSARRIVPGDIVSLEAGSVAPADMRVIEAASLAADESALTGESVPSAKKVGTIDERAPLAERWNMVFKGTGVTRGSGKAVVVATGMDTEIGRISRMAQEAEGNQSPLERRLEDLGKHLVWITLSIALVVAVIGLWRGERSLRIIETAIALAVAAIPEGLPVVATIALARGMWRMARRHAIVNRLSAVETLGSTNVVFTDKTGTLTENRMTVRTFGLPEGDGMGEFHVEEGRFTRDGTETTLDQEQPLKEALRFLVLCNDAELAEDPEADTSGDPMELALLEAGAAAGMRRRDLLERMPERRKVAFDPEVKMMATFHEDGDGHLVAIKGAPEAVIDAAAKIATPDGERPLEEEDRKRWIERNDAWAAQGLRVLALAGRRARDADEEPYEGMTFRGLVGLHDPPREGVKEAVETLQEAGLEVIMVTGDQPATARAIARDVGLRRAEDGAVLTYHDLEDLDREESEACRVLLTRAPIFARVTPEQKLGLIHLFKADGRIVAMTGDGVNDAPALKKADIGVAMGRRGTQVAREAADVILEDDAFSSIAAAVEQGRAIFENIRKFIIYLLSGNVGEIMIVAFALLVGWGLPLLPLQILYLNMLGDVFPALALGLGRGGPKLMHHPPRAPGEPIMTRRHWGLTALYGAIIAAPVLAAFRLAGPVLGMDDAAAVSTSFLTLSLARIWHTFNMRDADSGILDNDVVRNVYVWLAVALCVVLLVGAVYLPALARALDLVPPGLDGWLFIAGMSLLPFVLVQVAKILVRSRMRSEGGAPGGEAEGNPRTCRSP